MQELLDSLPEPMQLNGSIFVIAVVFLVLLIILNTLVFKPLIAVLQERQKKIEEGAEAQRASMEKVEESMAAYQNRLLEARRGAQQKRNKILKESEMVRDEVVSAAREQGFAMVQAAATEIDQQVLKTRDSLKREAEEIARKIVSSVLSRTVS